MVSKFPTLKSKEKINMLKFTRIYKVKATGELKTQPVSVNPEFAISVRPSNRLDGQRSTLLLAGGAEYELTETYKEVNAAIAKAVAA